MFKTSIKSLTLMATLAMPLTAGAVTYDSFTTPLKWDVFSYGQGKPYTIQRNGKLEVNIPARSAGPVFGAGYTSLCKLRGDFDVKVDYELINFPAANGVRVGITSGNIASKAKWGMGAETMRISRGASDGGSFSEAYITNINQDCCHDIQTSDQTGKLRMTRQGDLLSGYYFDNSTQTWTLIDSNTVTLGDTAIEIGAWSHDSAFSDQPIKVLFDNVVISKGTLVGASCSTN